MHNINQYVPGACVNSKKVMLHLKDLYIGRQTIVFEMVTCQINLAWSVVVAKDKHMSVSIIWPWSSALCFGQDTPLTICSFYLETIKLYFYIVINVCREKMVFLRVQLELEKLFVCCVQH